MKRRTALQVIAGGVAAEQLGAAQHHLVTLAQAPGSYKLQFFNPVQNEMLEQLCLNRAAFLRRPDSLHVYAFPGPSVAAGDPDFMNSAPWMLFQSDDDCP